MSFLAIVLPLLAGVALLLAARRKPRPAAPPPAARPVAAAAPKPAPQPTTNWLVGAAGPVAGKTYFIGNRVATIGRSPENLIQVSSPEVSRFHCQLRVVDGSLQVTDMRSRAGVRVQGERIAMAKLAPGDALDIGSARFIFDVRVVGAASDATREWKASTREHALETAVPQVAFAGDDEITEPEVRPAIA